MLTWETAHRNQKVTEEIEQRLQTYQQPAKG